MKFIHPKPSQNNKHVSNRQHFKHRTPKQINSTQVSSLICHDSLVLLFCLAFNCFGLTRHPAPHTARKVFSVISQLVDRLCVWLDSRVCLRNQQLALAVLIFIHFVCRMRGETRTRARNKQAEGSVENGKERFSIRDKRHSVAIFCVQGVGSPQVKHSLPLRSPKKGNSVNWCLRFTLLHSVNWFRFTIRSLLRNLFHKMNYFSCTVAVMISARRRSQCNYKMFRVENSFGKRNKKIA